MNTVVPPSRNSGGPLSTVCDTTAEWASGTATSVPFQMDSES
jgi:hypothetical protein